VPGGDVLSVAAETGATPGAKPGATPYDIPGVEYGHHGEFCGFDAFIKRHNLADPALHKLALIVRGADCGAPHLAKASAGLLAISRGLSLNFEDDHEMLKHGMVIYDAPLKKLGRLMGLKRLSSSCHSRLRGNDSLSDDLSEYPPVTRPLLIARALWAFADCFICILLPAYLLALGLGTFEVGVLSATTLLGSALFTLLLGTALLMAALLMAVTEMLFAALGSLAAGLPDLLASQGWAKTESLRVMFLLYALAGGVVLARLKLLVTKTP
jgi:hypothetical protein